MYTLYVKRKTKWYKSDYIYTAGETCAVRNMSNITISVHVEAGTANAHHQWWYCIWTEAFQRQQVREKPLIDKIPIMDPQKFKL